MTTKGVTSDPVTEIARICGGTQNLMYRFRSGGRQYVLRRGPQHLRPNTNDALPGRRACAGKAPRRVGDMLHGVAVGLLTQATGFIEEGL